MRVLLIAANTERINMPTPPLGAALVAAASRAMGHEVELLDLMPATDPAAAVGEEPDTLEDVYEPFLLQLGFLARTPKGRQATPRAFEHLGVAPGAGIARQDGLFEP